MARRFLDLGKIRICFCTEVIHKLYITEWIGIGLIVIVTIGAILHPTNINKLENCVYTEYKDCERTRFGDERVCFKKIEVTKNLSGNIILYYELPSYNQTEKTYATSRDNRQLSGELSLKPSSDCGNFTYNGNTPIAPCGAIADSFFNDTFGMRNSNNKYFTTLRTGLIDESVKARYRNPEGDLKMALKDFAKPIHWTKNVWELDTVNNNGSDNNGFQNEAFIAWMETDMKRKPVWRVEPSDLYREGLAKGSYIARIVYNYPRSLYDGERWIILCGDPSEDVNITPFIVWLTLAVIGILMAIATRPVINSLKYSK